MWRRNWWPSLAFAGTLDETGDVGDDEVGVIVDLDDTEIRFEGGEGIVGDLRFGCADHTDQRALADIGKSDEGDVRHQLQFELQPDVLPVFALLSECRCPALVRPELGVASAPRPPAAQSQRSP
jgi:hypothetical protein